MKHYSEDISSVLLETKSSAEGLTSGEAAKRLEENGKNKLAEGKKISLLRDPEKTSITGICYARGGRQHL